MTLTFRIDKVRKSTIASDHKMKRELYGAGRRLYKAKPQKAPTKDATSRLIEIMSENDSVKLPLISSPQTIASGMSLIRKPLSRRSLVEISKCVNTMKSMPAFSGVSDYLICQMLKSATIVDYENDEAVYFQTATIVDWHVVLEGSINLHHGAYDTVEDVRRYGKKVGCANNGFAFGDPSEYNHSESALTVGKCSLLVLSKEEYFRLFW
jgi:hypothetical protein